MPFFWKEEFHSTGYLFDKHMFLCCAFCFGSSPLTPQAVMKDTKILLLLQRTGGGEDAKRGGEEKRSVSEQQTAGRTFQKGITSMLFLSRHKQPQLSKPHWPAAIQTHISAFYSATLIHFQTCQAEFGWFMPWVKHPKYFHSLERRSHKIQFKAEAPWFAVYSVRHQLCWIKQRHNIYSKGGSIHVKQHQRLKWSQSDSDRLFKLLIFKCRIHLLEFLWINMYVCSLKQS